MDNGRHPETATRGRAVSGVYGGPAGVELPAPTGGRQQLVVREAIVMFVIDLFCNSHLYNGHLEAKTLNW